MKIFFFWDWGGVFKLIEKWKKIVSNTSFGFGKGMVDFYLLVQKQSSLDSSTIVKEPNLH